MYAIRSYYELPGSSFVPPNTALRGVLNDAASARIVALAGADVPKGLADMVDERAIVNARNNFV